MLDDSEALNSKSHKGCVAEKKDDAIT